MPLSTQQRPTFPPSHNTPPRVKERRKDWCLGSYPAGCVCTSLGGTQAEAFTECDTCRHGTTHSLLILSSWVQHWAPGRAGVQQANSLDMWLVLMEFPVLSHGMRLGWVG